jgi:hypothetical protein
MLLTIEFLAAPAHIDIIKYQFGGSANHLFGILCVFVELADKLYNP